MFFIGGITQGTKELIYNAAAMICGRCGRYGRYQVFMTYMCLSFSLFRSLNGDGNIM